MSETNKPPMSFWIISVIGLLWNLMGVLAYIGQAFITEEALELLPPEQVEFMNNTPAWVTAAFAIAVFAGMLGCIALLIRKKWATPLLILSFIAALAQTVHNFAMTNGYEVFGGTGLIMPVLVILIGIFLIRFSRSSTAKGWLS
ncbi:hypothetical protein GWK08_09465 [Leptobacterium flavescens]|uniref:Sugar transporter n=1 Tax=Leptobacterium flavescens TaxID=472055 RepID=A0A6P0UK38_9FLAO|nr:hypothetical protein [Leptobacterium flavescens]NER13665.1 hypothetical protein [Leptobacterium flavescens]